MTRCGNISWTLAWSLALGCGFTGAVRAQSPYGPDLVTLTVRAPDGSPLTNHAVKIYDTDSFQQEPLAEHQTDSQGRVTVHLADGSYQLRVYAPGVGYSATGIFIARPTGSATPALPPMAAFGRVIGTVPANLRAPDETAETFDYPGMPMSASPSSPVDADGHFTLSDLFPGSVGIELYSGKKQIGNASAELPPGGNVVADNFSPITYPPYMLGFNGTAKPVLTTIAIRGTVTDADGMPVAGAAVTASVPNTKNIGRVFFDGPFDGPQTEPTVLEGSTGTDGSYTLAGVVIGSPPETISVRAQGAGMPETVQLVTTAQNQHADLHCDLILPTQHTALTVHIIAESKPVVGATVTVNHDGNSPIYNNTDQAFSPDSQGMMILGAQGIGLSAKTDADGVARFANLMPGVYQIEASSGEWPMQFFQMAPPSYQEGDSHGIAIQANNNTQCTVELNHMLQDDLSVTALGPDGKPVTGSIIGAGSLSNLGSGFFQAQSQQKTNTIDKSGLWQVTVKYSGFTQAQSSLVFYNSPYSDADALVAASPALPPPAPMTLHLTAHQPGSIRVELEDAAGKPARGTVLTPGFGGQEPEYAASTDAQGIVEFAAMPPGQYAISGFLAGQPMPTFDITNLTGQTWIFPQPLTLSFDQNATVVLRPQPVGYVRVLGIGQMKSRGGGYVNVYDNRRTGRPYGWARQQDDPKTNSIIYGPIPVGPDTISVSRSLPGNKGNAYTTVKVDIQQDQVATVTVTPQELTTAPNPESEPLTGTVVLSDGHTPAWNAEAVVCTPFPDGSRDQLSPQAPTNARGNFPGYADGYAQIQQPYIGRINGETQLPPPPPNGHAPKTPVVVAWLPGSTGATIVPYVAGQSVHITLPPSITATGKVTVAGGSVSGLGSTFRIRAEYLGLGQINDLLSVDVTAQPDGTFTLPGLTPGSYVVQAARDNIWLSPEKILTVTAKNLSPTLTLDIPPPGNPVILQMVDSNGHALPHQPQTYRLEFSSQEPLADRLWPETITSDGNGDLHLDGFSPGPHEVFDWLGDAIKFNVPPLNIIQPGVPTAETAVIPALPIN
jgi:protocatechuate 3,4-dioxygenase beta subunit